ncbi:MAG: low molecular weight protein arginine phosphatase [Anaerolineae bacterium]
MAEAKTILFVCTGNLCRSPMAVGLLKEQLKRHGRQGEYRVRSAGTWTLEGHPAAPYALQVMAERGLDIGDHRSHALTRGDVEAADLILVMTRGHQEAIEAEFPQARGKTYLLSEMVGQSYDIPDPYGASLAMYRRCADELEDLIEDGYEKIVELAGT